MSRPTKCRRVCRMPDSVEFHPAGDDGGKEPIVMTVDEYETIRLIDKVGLSQEDCGNQMNVARTTVQQIYTSARAKLARCLVDGVPLRIEGGNYRLCDGEGSRHLCGGCARRRFRGTPERHTERL